MTKDKIENTHPVDVAANLSLDEADAVSELLGAIQVRIDEPDLYGGLRAILVAIEDGQPDA